MKNKNKKKSTYKAIAEAIASGEIGKAAMPTENLDMKKLSKKQLVSIVKEEFEKAKDVADTKAKESDFHDAELAKEINWVKTLKLEAFFAKKK